MASSLIVYYSYDGNCEMVADWIQGALESDVERLLPKDEKRRSGLSKFLWGGKQVLAGGAPELQNGPIALENYDLIFLGTPIWAGNFVPAFNTFFANYALQNKKIALFCCHGGGGKGRSFDKMKRFLTECEVIGELDLANPLWKNTEKNYERLLEWLEHISVYDPA